MTIRTKLTRKRTTSGIPRLILAHKQQKTELEAKQNAIQNYKKEKINEGYTEVSPNTLYKKQGNVTEEQIINPITLEINIKKTTQKAQKDPYSALRKQLRKLEKLKKTQKSAKSQEVIQHHINKIKRTLPETRDFQAKVDTKRLKTLEKKAKDIYDRSMQIMEEGFAYDFGTGIRVPLEDKENEVPRSDDLYTPASRSDLEYQNISKEEKKKFWKEHEERVRKAFDDIERWKLQMEERSEQLESHRADIRSGYPVVDTISGTFQEFGRKALGLGSEFPEFMAFTTVKGVAIGDALINPYTREEIWEEIKSKSILIPPQLLNSFNPLTQEGRGNLYALALYPQAFKNIPTGAKNAINSAVNKVIRTKVPPETVFSESALKGQNLEFAKSPQDILKQFKATKDHTGKLTGAHTTIAKVPKQFEAITGRHSLATGDQGLFITPWGKAQPQFLRLTTQETPLYKISLNPFKDLWNDPKVLKIKFSEVQRIPEHLIQQKGWTQTNEYIRNLNEGTATVTKRAEVGTRGLKDIRKGTREVEAILKPGQLLKRTANQEYTVIRNQAVRIPTYEAYSSKSKPTRAQLFEHNRALKELTRYNNELYSYTGRPTSYYNPYFSSLINYYTNYNKQYKPYNKQYKPYKRDNYSRKPPGAPDYYKDRKRKQKHYFYFDYYKPGGYYEEYTPDDYSYYSEHILNLNLPKKATNKRKLLKFKPKQNKMTISFQPITQHINGQQIPGPNYKTKTEAVQAGMMHVDNTKAHQFRIQKNTVPKGVTSQLQKKYRKLYKFRKHNNKYVEKRYYRFDTPNEKGMNIMPYVFGK